MNGSISPEEGSREVQQLENVWAAAILQKDLSALDRILGPEYVLRTAGGNISRAEWLATIEWMEPKALEVYDQNVNVYGEVAVIQGLLYWHVVRSEKVGPDPRTGSREVQQNFIVTDIWVRRGSQWQVIHRHSTIALDQPGSRPSTSSG